MASRSDWPREEAYLLLEGPQSQDNLNTSGSRRAMLWRGQILTVTLDRKGSLGETVSEDVPVLRCAALAPLPHRALTEAPPFPKGLTSHRLPLVPHLGAFVLTLRGERDLSGGQNVLAGKLCPEQRGRGDPQGSSPGGNAVAMGAGRCAPCRKVCLLHPGGVGSQLFPRPEESESTPF